MTIWNDIIVGLSLLLLVFLVWKEASRSNRSRRAVRIVAGILMAISLACLGLPLATRQRGAHTANEKVAVLLTEGYVPDSLRRFLRDISSGNVMTFANTDELIYAESRANEPEVSESGASGSTGNEAPFSALHVFGYGLTMAEWAELHDAIPGLPSVTLHSSPAQTGMVSASWRQKLYEGEPLRIQGMCLNTTGKPLKLVLSGLNASLDSVILPATPTGAFTLTAVPLHKGRAVYQIRLMQESRVLEEESLPVEVLPAKSLKILMLASTPGFDNRFLANWLVQHGHQLAMRTMISKDKYEKGYLNMSRIGLGRLSPSLLDRFDILIADAKSLQDAGPSETALLRREVADKGMGLIIRADSAVTGFYGSLFSLEGTKDSTRQRYLKDRPGMMALLRDSLSRITVGSMLYGAGRIILTTVHNSYSTILSGHQKEFAAQWSPILGHAARMEYPVEEQLFTPALPRVRHPVEVLLQRNGSVLPQVQLRSAGEMDAPGAVYFARYSNLSYRWQGMYWPEEAGWQYGCTASGDTSWWYAWQQHDWLTLDRRQRLEDSRRYIADAAIVPGSSAPVSRIWFYIPFLLGCLFLWIEKKSII